MTIGKPERATQERVIRLFHEELGYDFLGDWTDRAGNSNIDECLSPPPSTSCAPNPPIPTAACMKTTKRSTAFCVTAYR